MALPFDRRGIARGGLTTLVALLALVPACNYRVSFGAHDSGGCTSAADCGERNQCSCGRCVSLELRAPACNPPCEVATDGDFCDTDGARCESECSVTECVAGTWRTQMGTCDGGAATDAGCTCADPPPAGCRYVDCGCTDVFCDEPQRCGRTVCTGGYTCCNASCGICVPTGGSCEGLPCGPDCAPMDAVGYGTCAVALGYAWDGGACRALEGCECVGEECPAVFASQVDCEAVFHECARTCGTIAGLACAADEWCDYVDGATSCGGGDGSGTCTERPATCPPGDDPVCGCDARTYANECEAHAAGFDVLDRGPCTDCDPDDVIASGVCGSVYGYAWTGSGCVAVQCACEGSDCATIAGRDEIACLDAHATCGTL